MKNISVQGRPATGVKVQKIDAGDKITGISMIGEAMHSGQGGEGAGGDDNDKDIEEEEVVEEEEEEKQQQ